MAAFTRTPFVISLWLVTVQVRTAVAAAPATIKIRDNVTHLSADEVDRFREAVRGMLAKHDNNGFEFYAGWHGVPLGICEHHNRLFLPWHRGYLYHFEVALQDVDPTVTLPWWNWMDEADIPPAYSGDDNILAVTPIEPFGFDPQPDWPTETTRDPGGATDPAPLPPPLRVVTIRGQEVNFWDWMMGSPSYDQFMQRCWRLHDNIHGWVGGTMSDPNWAAFDPLFWAHHTMVDRLWRIWQHNNPGALPDEETLDTSMTFAKAPSFKVHEVLDVTQLGYEYSGQSATVGGTV
jgi:tyrosinase